MTDLQINIALAQAMGWEHCLDANLHSMPIGSFILVKPSPFTPKLMENTIICKAHEDFRFDGRFREFDYRDPVIFVAICKHWGLDANFHKSRVDGFVNKNVFSQLAYRHEANTCSMEKAAALVVIEYAKRKSMLDELAKRGIK